MGADELERHDGTDAGSRRRRRRRRRNRRTNPEPALARDPVARDPGPREGADGSAASAGRDPSTPRRHARAWRTRDDSSPAVNLPSTGRVPRQRLPAHPYRGKPASSAARRRRMPRADMEALAGYFERMPDQLVANLYSSMGGQPQRVANPERMIQLTVRAIAQGNRMGDLVRSLHQRDRQALAILVQCGGLAHHDEFRQELTLSLGGNDREWKRVMATLGDKGLVASSDEQDGHYFYLVPEPLVDHLVEHLHEDLALPHFEHEDVKVLDGRVFTPPLDFTIVTLATYIDQHPPRLTQRQEIFKVHKEEMDQFFAQIWPPDSELFSFHVEFLMLHGMVELRGDRLVVNRAVVEEWLQLDPEDQRDLVFASLQQRFPYAEWVLWAVNDAGGAWIPERPMQALYRRWRRGEEWRERFASDDWGTPKSAQREAWSFSPLVHTGMLELGQWGQEKFYRLTVPAQRLLALSQDEGFTQFYLTPSFEIMAPAGMAPILFFRIGELSELTACDRANTYKITEVSIERALEKGWRRDDVLEFLRDNSQIGLPENVESTLRGWMGHHGDVEYHDVMLLTVHRSQIRRLETHRRIKPYLLHRFVPGMYAVDRARLPELNAVLIDAGFSPGQQPRKYPDDPQQVEARERLLSIVTKAREEREDLVSRAHSADTQPEDLQLIPGSAAQQKPKRRRRDDLPPRRSPREVREICERAIALGQQLDMLYVTRDKQRKLLRVEPERLATNPQGQQVLVARDVARNERLSYQIIQVERLAAVSPK